MTKKRRQQGGRHSVPGDKKDLPTRGVFPPGPELLPPIPETARHIAITEQKSVSTSFSGPIPPPAILKQYDDLIPGTAKQIIEQAHKQTDHRISMEKRVVEAEVSRSKWGLVAGFAIALTCIIEGGLLVYSGHDTAGATIATGAVASLVAVFVYGTAMRRKEREDKARIMTGQK